MLSKKRENNLKKALHWKRKWEIYSINIVKQSQLLSWQSEQRLDWVWGHCQEVSSLLSKELMMVLRLLEVRSWLTSQVSSVRQSAYFQDFWISDSLLLLLREPPKIRGFWWWESPQSLLRAFRRTSDEARRLKPVQLKSIRPLPYHDLSYLTSVVSPP